MKHLGSIIASGGYFMIPMFICSIVGLAIIIERTFALRRQNVISREMLDVLKNWQAGTDIQDLDDAAAHNASTLGRIVRSAVSHLDSPKNECMEAVQISARSEAVKLERGLITLEIIVGISPLLGLLGTVSGLITVFSEFGNGGDAAVKEAAGIASGISEALIMTVAGLMVAIPSLIVHSYYSRRVERYMTEMEGYLLDFLARYYRHQTSMRT